MAVKKNGPAKPQQTSSVAAGRRTTTPQSTATGNTWQPQQGEVGIRVRMYRVGFGDFFLVSLLGTDGKPVHMIIDCGVFKGTSQTGDLGSIEAAVADMAETTDRQVALIIMTHRHADHIAGFARCADLFKTLTVGAVWMPIWESEYEPVAIKFQAELTHVAAGLRTHFTSFGAHASKEQATARKYMENATGEQGAAGVAARGSNAAALDLLKHGFQDVTPHYYKRGDTAALPQALADVGLEAQILGPPPIAALDLMTLMDLKKGVGQYLADQNVGKDSGDVAPFGDEWEIDPPGSGKDSEAECYRPESFREWVQPRKKWGKITRNEARPAREFLERALEASQPIAAIMAAKKLNAFLNNQSLVVLFTFRGKKLLFVGDAQAGNWQHWLFDTNKRQVESGMSATAKQILTSLDFYKMGHHGSSNSTPKAVVEVLGQGRRFTTMCSTEAGVYGTENPDDPSKGTEVPRDPLCEQLDAESAFVRSDQVPITVAGQTKAAQVLAPLPAAAPGTRLQTFPLGVDCFL
jgi:hypothetical protein